MNTVDVDALEREYHRLCGEEVHPLFYSDLEKRFVLRLLTALRQQQEAEVTHNEWMIKADAEIARLRTALTWLVQVVETCEEYSYSRALEGAHKALKDEE